MILSLTFWAFAVALYGIHELTVHGKIRWGKGIHGFWTIGSWRLKYKYTFDWDEIIHEKYPKFEKAPNNWYYRLIKSKYVERWPTSTWLTVMFTDAPHLLQFFYCILFCISAVSYEREFGRLIDGCIYWGVWHLSFWLVYNSLQRKRAKIA